MIIRFIFLSLMLLSANMAQAGIGYGTGSRDSIERATINLKLDQIEASLDAQESAQKIAVQMREAIEMINRIRREAQEDEYAIDTAKLYAEAMEVRQKYAHEVVDDLRAELMTYGATIETEVKIEGKREK